MSDFIYRCALDATQCISIYKFSVTLLTDSGGTSLFRGKHVQIFFERVDDCGHYVAEIYHMTGISYIPIVNFFSQSGEHVKRSDMTERILKLGSHAIRYVTKTKTFLLDRRDIELMLEKIKATSKKSTFHLLGRHSVLTLPSRYLGRMKDNCFTWALDKLYYAGIKFPAYISNITIYSDPLETIVEHAEFSTEYNLYDLCKLAKEGADEVIRRHFPLNTNVNQLVSTPYPEGPVEFCLWQFTPLSLAVAYQQFSTVQMLFEEYGANLNFIIGFYQNYTALDCAKKTWWGGVYRGFFCDNVTNKITSYLIQHHALTFSEVNDLQLCRC